jgi:ribosomal protein L44E
MVRQCMLLQLQLAQLPQPKQQQQQKQKQNLRQKQPRLQVKEAAQQAQPLRQTSLKFECQQCNETLIG